MNNNINTINNGVTLISTPNRLSRIIRNSRKIDISVHNPSTDDIDKIELKDDMGNVVGVFVLTQWRDGYTARLFPVFTSSVGLGKKTFVLFKSIISKTFLFNNIDEADDAIKDFEAFVSEFSAMDIVNGTLIFKDAAPIATKFDIIENFSKSGSVISDDADLQMTDPNGAVKAAVSTACVTTSVDDPINNGIDVVQVLFMLI